MGTLCGDGIKHKLFKLVCELGSWEKLLRFTMKKSENEDWHWIQYKGCLSLLYAERSYRNVDLAAQFLWNLIGIACCNVYVLLESVGLDTYDLDFQHIPDVVLLVVYLYIWE